MKRPTKIIVSVFFFAIFQMEAGAMLSTTKDVWLIDTHNVSWAEGTEQNFQKIAYYRLVGNRWLRVGSETFYQTQAPRIPLVVFSPGYTATRESTIEVGMQLLRLCDPDKPVRMVFWNWPAQREVLGLRRDIRAKIPIAEANARYLAMFLKKLQPESKVCLLGFSFGTRLIGDAIEQFGNEQPEGMRLHLVLAGAATDRHWLASNGRNRNVPRLADKILILYNPDDFRLQFYPCMYDIGYNPQALGRFGPPMSRINSDYRHKIEAVNINPQIGIRHSTLIHFQTPAFRKRIGEYLFFM